MKKPNVHALAVATAATTVLVSGQVSAAGFAVAEQSAAALGTALAGAGVLSEDASNQFYNPATLGEFEKSQLTAVFHYVMIDTGFEDGNSATTGDLEDVEEPVGGAFLAMPFRDDMVFGLSVTVPYGSVLEYEPVWGGDVTPLGISTGEFYAQKSDLQAVNVNPALSWELSDVVTLGAGVSYQTLDAELDNAATRLDGDDAAWGWNIGAVVEVAEGHRVGASWRSKIDYDIEGDVSFSPEGLIAQGVPPATAASLAGTYDAQTSVTLPAVAILSYAGELDDRTDLLLEVAWTEWSELDAFEVSHEGPASLTNPLLENLEWNNSVRSSIGVRHALSEELVLRVGYAHETATQGDDEERSALVPDADRDWVALGARLFPAEALTLDLGYAHVFVDDGDINRAERGALVGEYELAADIVGAQLNWAF